MRRHLDFSDQIQLSLLLCLGLIAPVQAEGTRELGLAVGLSQSTVVHIAIDAPDEVLSFCASDEGVQAPPVLGQSLDLNPGDPVEKDPLRAGADIVVYPPTDVPCVGPDACAPRQICFNRSLELPFEFGPSGDGDSFCGYAFRISPTADPDAGFCDAQTQAPNHFELLSTETGVWRFDFVGERSTTGAPQRNTRFFDIGVRTGTGQIVRSPRVFSYQWYLSTHAAEQETDHSVYLRRRVSNQTSWVRADLSGVSQFSYGLVANRSGILENGGIASQCERVVDGRIAQNCPLSIEGRRAALSAQLPLFLSPPSSSDSLTPSIEALLFQDDQGTGSISPNGDGIQDTAVVSFSSNLPGILRLWIDVDGDGTMNDPKEMVLKSEFGTGDQSIEWNGTDGTGTTIAPGDYEFSLYYSFGEYHLIAVGLESLTDGLTFSFDDEASIPTYWDDTPVMDPTTPLQFQTPWHETTANRAWRQEEWPVTQRPVLFDTWSNLASHEVNQASCIRCEEPSDRFRIGPIDEDADNDLDGLSNSEEDTNGNGRIDPGETDANDADTDEDGLDDRIETRGEPSPVRPDTDQDGISDGVEDESGDGFYQEGETDPTDPDTDNDRLYDGQEDVNGNGRVDPGETDPRLADTDGDGINDGDDPFPLDPAPDSGFADGFIPLATNGDAFGLGSDATMDIVNTNGYEEDGFFGCDCSSHSAPQSTFYVLCVLLGLACLRSRMRD